MPVPLNVIAAQDPADFIGPAILGAIVHTLEAGIVVSQSVRFWSHSTDRHLLVKSIVAFVSLAEACVYIPIRCLIA